MSNDRRRLRSKADLVTIDAARTLDDLMAVVSLRAIVYLGEQHCPFDEEFDGNDLNGTHLLARIGGEPVATMRMRWFADFMKIERVCVRPDHRGGPVVFQMVKYGLDLAARKGYRRVLGYIQVRLFRFWERFGFFERPGRERFMFSDYEYMEFEGKIEPHPDALSADSSPFVLMRPEGDWDRAGVLDASAGRPDRGGEEDEALEPAVGETERLKA